QDVVDVEEIGRQQRSPDQPEDEQHEGHRLGADQHDLPERTKRRGVLCRRRGVGIGGRHCRTLWRLTIPCSRTVRSMSSAMRITAPYIAACDVPGMPRSGSAEATQPSSSTPSTVPSTVPTPPLIDTPPITTAAITWNSKPLPVLEGFTKPQRLA